LRAQSNFAIQKRIVKEICNESRAQKYGYLPFIFLHHLAHISILTIADFIHGAFCIQSTKNQQLFQNVSMSMFFLIWPGWNIGSDQTPPLLCPTSSQSKPLMRY
jgi:low temperature requirement protein LtrA